MCPARAGEGRGGAPVRLKAWHFVALAMALAAVVAGWRLGDEPFWLDEFVTWRWAHLPFAEIWPQALRGHHPPLYFWFMHGWVRLVPSLDEVWLRLPSVLFFVLTVPLVYRIGWMLSGTPRAGVYAAFLVATWPFFLHYGREARSYAMVTFFGVCAFLAALHLVSRYRTTQPRLIGAGLLEAVRLLARGHWRDGWRALGDDGAWAGYIASSVVVMWLHNTAGMVPMATGLILLCAIGTAPSFRGLRFANLCIAAALIALFYSPQLPHLLAGMGRLDLPYIPPTDLGRIVHTSWVLYDNGRFPFVVLGGLAVAAMAVWAWRGEWERVAFAGIGWLGAMALLIAFSFWTLILRAQFLLWTLAPFLAACGAGIALVPWNFVRILLLAALLASSAEGVVREWGHVKENWRGLARVVVREASPDAAMLVYPNFYRYLFRHYRQLEGQETANLHVAWIRNDLPEVFEVAGPAAGDPGPEVDPAGLFAKYPEVWVIRGSGLDPLATALEERGRLKRTWGFGGVRLEWYARRE